MGDAVTRFPPMRGAIANLARTKDEQHVAQLGIFVADLLIEVRQRCRGADCPFSLEAP